MKFSFEQIQKAFIDERITLNQFIEVLIDNFGIKKTRKILSQNLKLALKKEHPQSHDSHYSQSVLESE